MVVGYLDIFVFEEFGFAVEPVVDGLDGVATSERRRPDASAAMQLHLTGRKSKMSTFMTNIEVSENQRLSASSRNCGRVQP